MSTNLDRKVVAAAAPVDPNETAEVTVDPRTGGVNVYVTAGVVSVVTATTSTLDAANDVTVTTTPTALPALAAGPGGIIVQADDGNDPTFVCRVASNATSARGITLRPGQSYVFENIANASGLLVVLQAPVSGAAVLHVEQV